MTRAEGVEILAFFPADHAVTVDSKAYVNGGFWDRLRFPTFPQVLPISLMAVLRIPFHAYHADHSVVIGMEDADGVHLPLRVEGSFRVGSEPDMKYGDPTILPIAITVNNLLIQAPGDFVFTLQIDDLPVARYPIRAMQVAAPIVSSGPSPSSSVPPAHG
jgi:hypothetical protein